eukprot:TRINITY_DN331_c1_g2_i1.p1 TRINITY_DN331_c1_g2~~TRINITY_DN331_c1_g2_i1.p1  ORF type:complete len:255 (-),score=64.44 TRINITY_DN331_c1_g2_i1:283-1047(-)
MEEEKIIWEVCIDSVESAIQAEIGGADRVELCSALMEGGLTPSYGLIKLTRSKIKIPIYAMIRPRGGDFLYNKDEFEIMKEDIKKCKELGVNGVVFGILNEEGKIDVERMKILKEISNPLKITFHRAFDMVKNPIESLEVLEKLEIERILTSGCENTVLEGIDLICELIQFTIDRNMKIKIMPGGGINERNIKKIASITKAKEFHTSGRKTIRSEMKYQNDRVSFYGTSKISEFNINVVDGNRIKNFIHLTQNK